MGVNALLAATLSLGLAAAVNVKPSLPYDSQTGAFNLGLACTLGGKAVTISALISATAPVTVNPGQTVYFEDIVATITVPASAVPSGVASINVLANGNVNVVNGSPSTVAVFPGGKWVNGTKITSGQPVVIRFPASGQLPGVGPLTTGSSGVTKLFLGALTSKVYTFDASGKATSKTPLALSCPAKASGAFLANLNIQGATGNTTVNAPSTGTAFTPSSSLAVGQIQGFFHTNYVCNLVGFQVPVDLVFGGAAVTSYKKGATFNLGQVTSFLNVGQNWINAAHSLYGATEFDTTVLSVTLNATNATPSTFNPIKTPISMSAQYQTSGGLNIIFPQTGYLSAGPFKATGAVGSYIDFYLGNSVAQVVMKNSTGAVVQNGTTTCVPTGTLDLFSVLITS